MTDQLFYATCIVCIVAATYALARMVATPRPKRDEPEPAEPVTPQSLDDADGCNCEAMATIRVTQEPRDAAVLVTDDIAEAEERRRDLFTMMQYVKDRLQECRKCGVPCPERLDLRRELCRYNQQLGDVHDFIAGQSHVDNETDKP